MLAAVSKGESGASELLLNRIYGELHQMAEQQMGREVSGQTLQPTALVNEAWLRLGGDQQPNWQNRAHFFSAAAEAMRRILVDRARRQARLRHGGGQQRLDIGQLDLPIPGDETVVWVSDILEELALEDPVEAEVVKLRFFVGLSNDEAAATLGVSEKSVRRYWTHAKAWLYERMKTKR